MSRSNWGISIFLIVMAAIAIPQFMPARRIKPLNACINWLRQIEGAKDQWAVDHNKSTNDIPTWEDLKQYIKDTPTCPAGGIYSINKVGVNAICSLQDKATNEDHALPVY